MRVEFCPVDLEGGQPRLITRANLDAVVERLIRPVGEPKPQTLLRQLLVAEVARQAEHLGKKTAAHLGGRFADLAIEDGRLFDNQNARSGPPPFDQERRGRAGKRAADDRDIELRNHCRRMMDCRQSKRNDAPADDPYQWHG